MTRLLDALSFPLRGSQLVEASAGTGKTFTISALYLRLVLGHGGEAAGFGRPLDPAEILVVTFTEAATQELRDRVRQRLAEGAAAFRIDPSQVPSLPAGRDLLHDLRASYPPEAWPACAHRLQLAAEGMDEAAISTIHGWCHRMLREHAFDSGSLLAQTLQPDPGELFLEAVRDWWRSFVYPLDAADAATLCGWWKTPAALAELLRSLAPHRELLAAGAAPQEALRIARTAGQAALAQWKQPWQRDVAVLREAIDASLRSGQLQARPLGHRGRWLQSLHDWAHGDDRLPRLTDKAWDRLSPAGMRDASATGTVFDHPLLHELADLRRRLGELPDGRDAVQQHAVHWVAERLAQEKARRAEMGFDDMLVQLDAALARSADARLAQRIRAQFPVALIDEFQDTDALQYRIFDAIYAVRAGAREQALVLIGDPKQAIYGFRGADIHAYLAARADTQGKHHTLGTNFRSSKAMCEAVNHLFGRAERRDPAGAFGFGTPAGNPLPFLPVQAHGRKEAWELQGEPAPALTCWWAEDERQLPEACAAEVLRLLQAGQQGRAGFRRPDGSLVPVRPGDMAVLVHTGTQARRVRAALQRAGVRSVYLSDQDPVYWSEAAADLQRLLQACAAPEDDRLLRAALATGLLGLDWAALERLHADESAWEDAVLRFRRYRDQWRRQGVLPMLRRLLHEHQVPHRLLAAGDERRLTDVLHLAELLQQAATELEGEHALVRHLAEQRAAQRPASDDSRILRLESDADLLKVVTVHKSKGLEYPLVFLPFGCHAKAVKGDRPLAWQDGRGRRLALRPDAEAVAGADRERLAEDLRKLYVALTRARFATWVGLAPGKEPHRSALGCLLGGPEPFEAASLPRLLATLAGECPSIAVQPVPPAATGRWQETGPPRDWAPEPPLRRTPHPPWWVASYSRLRTEQGAAGGPADAPESAAEATFLEEAVAPDGAWRGGAGPGLHGFPRGAGPGSFLHGLLEWAGREGFADVAADPGRLRRLLEQRCRARGWAEWAGPLADWLLAWLRAPLRLPGAPSPADLAGYQVEMEFWFATRRVDARRIDALVCEHTLDAAPRRRLQPQELNGLFKGYIDLVFEHQGRWWVADYKSNTLGAVDGDYTAEALRAEVLRHRYELQYALYLFALHRHLRSRLPDYDYDRHVGGAAYLFLRGHGGPAGGLHLERPPRALMDGLDALFAQEVAA
ncbi:exodeoxyribonuclease V subunit beta [Ramlibacter sp. AW1]|uniref:RecBCD enzyme subunit RecB n=1 Tax=Ramlibacter aurantiacus TaxID=2801330 RepID=A0A936ZPA0_9BURK|nr:exodeoxyribonuclease V subunit beta [Ramlibacter aurantiacus]MBL0419936.1 exodeoxyribonuclease V subunit beta [Ramlibacter aurantiacus]